MTEPPHKWGEVGYKAKDYKRSALDKMFFSPDDHRLRAGWRMLLFLFLFAIVSPFWLIPSGIQIANFGDDQLALALREMGKVLAFTIPVLLARKVIDERSIPSLGLKLDRWTILDFCCGVGISFGIMAIGFLLMAGLGIMQIQSFAWQADTFQTIVANLIGLFLIFTLVGWSEELVFRGYFLQNAIEGTNIFWGVLLSSLFFSAAHLSNVGITAIGLFMIFLGGILFSYAYLTTKQLWLAVALHLGWDFFGTIFLGFSISGVHLYRLVQSEVQRAGGGAGIFLFFIIILTFFQGILVYQYSKITAGRRNPANPANPAPQ